MSENNIKLEDRILVEFSPDVQDQYIDFLTKTYNLGSVIVLRDQDLVRIEFVGSRQNIARFKSEHFNK